MTKKDKFLSSAWLTSKQQQWLSFWHSDELFEQSWNEHFPWSLSSLSVSPLLDCVQWHLGKNRQVEIFNITTTTATSELDVRRRSMCVQCNKEPEGNTLSLTSLLERIEVHHFSPFHTHTHTHPVSFPASNIPEIFNWKCKCSDWCLRVNGH